MSIKSRGACQNETPFPPRQTANSAITLVTNQPSKHQQLPFFARQPNCLKPKQLRLWPIMAVVRRLGRANDDAASRWWRRWLRLRRRFSALGADAHISCWGAACSLWWPGQPRSPAPPVCVRLVEVLSPLCAFSGWDRHQPCGRALRRRSLACVCRPVAGAERGVIADHVVARGPIVVTNFTPDRGEIAAGSGRYNGAPGREIWPLSATGRRSMVAAPGPGGDRRTKAVLTLRTVDSPRPARSPVPPPHRATAIMLRTAN